MILQGDIDPTCRTGIQYVLAYSTAALAARPSRVGTFHQYETDLPSWLVVVLRSLIHGSIQDALVRHHPPHYRVAPIHAMNELYVASLGAGGSDQVFETDHVDGPFWYLPGAHVYRCIVGVSENQAGIQTRFIERTVTVHQYEFVAFDYNHDLHAIQRAPRLDTGHLTPRVTLKLHYICYAPWLPSAVVFLYTCLHVAYNAFMRCLFLSAQTHHNTWCAMALASVIQHGTVAYGTLFKRGRP